MNAWRTPRVDVRGRMRTPTCRPTSRTGRRPRLSSHATKGSVKPFGHGQRDDDFQVFYWLSETPDAIILDAEVLDRYDGMVSYTKCPEVQREHDCAIVQDLVRQIETDVRGKYVSVVNIGNAHDHSSNSTWIRILEVFVMLGARSVSYELREKV